MQRYWATHIRLKPSCSASCRERVAGQEAAGGPLAQQCGQLSEAVATLGRRVDEVASRQQAPVSERAVKHDVSLLVDAVQVGRA